jgi:hypothetical protein
MRFDLLRAPLLPVSLLILCACGAAKKDLEAICASPALDGAGTQVSSDEGKKLLELLPKQPTAAARAKKLREAMATHGVDKCALADKLDEAQKRADYHDDVKDLCAMNIGGTDAEEIIFADDAKRLELIAAGAAKGKSPDTKALVERVRKADGAKARSEILMAEAAKFPYGTGPRCDLADQLGRLPGHTGRALNAVPVLSIQHGADPAKRRLVLDVEGELPEKMLTDAVKSKTYGIRACQQAAKLPPGTEKRVVIELAVDQSGTFSQGRDATEPPADAALAKCLVEAMNGVFVGAAPREGTRKVKVPITLK